MEREAFAQRLRETLKHIGDIGNSPTRLAREFNRRYPGTPITLHAARKWLNGEALPAQDKLRVLAAWLGVAPEWLRFGEGGEVGRATAYQAREPDTDVDYALAREIGSLSPLHQDAIRTLVKILKRGENRRH